MNIEKERDDFTSIMNKYFSLEKKRSDMLLDLIKFMSIYMPEEDLQIHVIPKLNEIANLGKNI